MKWAVLMNVALVWAVRAADPEIEKVSAASLGGDAPISLTIQLPTGYRADAEEDRRYPVIYLVHSFTGDASEWEQLGATGVAAELPMIVVMLDAEQSFLGNEPRGVPWETQLLEHVIPHVDATYRTVVASEARGIMGLSMGGHAALRLALTYPETFSSAGSVSGLIGCMETALNGSVEDRLQVSWGEPGSEARQALSLTTALARDRDQSPLPYLFLECGVEDPWIGAHRKWVAALQSKKISYEYRESPGKHDYAYWRIALTDLLPRLAKRVKENRRRWDKEREWRSLLGEWHAVAEISEGNEFKLETVFAVKNGKLTGTSDSAQGKSVFDRVTLDDGVMRYWTFTSERTVHVEAEIGLDGGMLGKWSILDSEGTPQASGPWRASRSP